MGKDRSETYQSGKGIHSEKRAEMIDNDDDGATAVLAEELPGRLTREVFAELATYRSSCCISVYFSANAATGVMDSKDSILLKNHLQDAAKTLRAKGHEPEEADRMLAPGYDLLKEENFWKTNSSGLALFIADGFFKYIRLSIAPATELICESTFYITPLVPLISAQEYFYLLVISKQQVKLFKADSFGMQYIPVENVPQGIDEVKRLSDKDASTRRAGSSGGNGGANFHGVGGGKSDEKENIATYFEAADDVVFKEVLNKENAPLLLAGVEYLIPIYKSVCDYHHVWEHSLTGSQEYEDTNSLYGKAMEIMQPYFQQRELKALNMYGNKSATELTSSIPQDVISGSYYGRVAQLFVQRGEHIWGSFDEEMNKLDVQDEDAEGAEDLIDNAVVKTLLSGGDVFLLDKDKMPADSSVAAIFRY